MTLVPFRGEQSLQQLLEPVFLADRHVQEMYQCLYQLIEVEDYLEERDAPAALASIRFTIRLLRRSIADMSIYRLRLLCAFQRHLRIQWHHFRRVPNPGRPVATVTSTPLIGDKLKAELQLELVVVKLSDLAKVVSTRLSSKKEWSWRGRSDLYRCGGSSAEVDLRLAKRNLVVQPTLAGIEFCNQRMRCRHDFQVAVSAGLGISFDLKSQGTKSKLATHHAIVKIPLLRYLGRASLSTGKRSASAQRSGSFTPLFKPRAAMVMRLP
eukprot:s4484_g1.t1